MYFDGSMMLSSTWIGVVMISPKGDKMQIQFPTSNNVAEYEALLHGLRITIDLGVRRLIYCSDSDLVVYQVMKVWETKDPIMATYCLEVRRLEGMFDGLKLHHMHCSENDIADTLAKMGSLREPVLPNVFLHRLKEPSVKSAIAADNSDSAPESSMVTASRTSDVLAVIPAWTQPFLDLRHTLPEDQTKGRCITRYSKAYTIIKGELYK